MAALGFLLHHICLSAPFPMFGFFRTLTVFVFLIESNRYEQILFIRPPYPQTLVRFFKLHAFCRCPAQPFGRRFGHRDGVAAKPAAGGGADYARRSAEELGISECFQAFLPKPNAYIDDQAVHEWRFCTHFLPINSGQIDG